MPEAGRAARGKPIVNLLRLEPGETVQGLLAVRDFEQAGRYIVTITRRGVVKRTELAAYGNIRAQGLIALTLDDDDELISVHNVGENDHVFVATNDGMAIRFPLSEVRAMGRTARGVKGIELREGDEVVSATVVRGDEDILTITRHGYGKRTDADEYRVQGRAGLGLINLKITDKTGPVVSSIPVHDDDELVVATKDGQTLRTPVVEIRRCGRSAQGVRIIRLKTDEDEVVSVTRSQVVPTEESGSGEGQD